MATILIVDDQPANRAYLVKLLGYAHHRMLEASDGAAALALVRAEGPDLVIADIVMPTMDGFEFVRQLRADPALARTQVIFYTAAYNEQEIRPMARACGVEHILTKPAAPQVIFDIVNAALGLSAALVAPVTPESFTREHLRLLTDKLTQKVTELEATSGRLDALLALGQELAAERDPQRLIVRSCQAARAIIGAAYSVVGVLETDGQSLHQLEICGLDAETIARMSVPAIDSGAIHTLMEQRHPLRQHNPSGDPQALELPADHPPVYAFLGVPIATVTQCYGWLGLRNKLGLDEFSPADEQLAVTLAAQLAVTYENAVRNDAIQRAQDAERVSQERLAGIVGAAMDAIISIDAEQRIVVFNTAAEQMFGCPAAAAIGQPIERFIPPAFRGDHAAHIHAFGQTGVTSRSMRSPGVLTALRADGAEFPIEATISQIVVAEQPLYTVIIRDISARKRVEQAMERSVERLRVLADASQAFAEASTEYQALLDRIARTATAALGEGCIIGLISDDQEWMQPALLYDVDPERCERLRFILGNAPLRMNERASITRIVNTNQALFLPIVDREQLRAATQSAYHALIDRQAIHSLLGVPMRVQGRPIGALMLYRCQPEQPPFDTDDLTLAQDLADRAALTIGNARLLTQMQYELAERQHAEQALERAAAHLGVLADASHTFAEIGADYQAVLDQVVRTIATMLSDGCAIRLVSEEGTWLQHAALYDTDPEKLEIQRIVAHEAPLCMAEPTFTTQTFQRNQPLLIPILDQEQIRATAKPEYASLVDRVGIHSLMLVPMRAQGRTIGVMSLSRHRHEQPPFNEADLTLAQDLADRAALAIENARLFQQAQNELSERKRAEETLQAERALLARRVEERTADLSLANAELARAARLKDEFLASMSHELRTPLNSVLGRSELLQEEIYGPLTSKQAEAVRGIEESGRHLLALINDILDLSKIEAGKLDLRIEPVAVALLCRMSLRMVAQTALQKHITITSSVDSHVVTIPADERRLKQILVNLLSNAVKFTPEGGQVGLEVQGDVEQHTATFTVRDSGIGIAEADLPRLFKPFIQIDSSLSRQYAGTGLGLALVLRLAQAHQGSVALDSTPGVGSRFSVTLPWNPAEDRSTSLPDTVVVGTSIPRIDRALVIEDSPTAAAQIARYLTDLSTNVEIQTQGSDAIERAIALRPDLIVLDILLPGQSGWHILRQLKSEPRTQAIPVVIVSVVDEPERARALGAAAFLLKPIDRVTVLRTLRHVITADSAPFDQTAQVIEPSPVRPRILLAEDNQANIDVLEDYLSVKGYAVVVARTGNEALMHAHEMSPALILMDIQMPGMDGLEAIQRIRADTDLHNIPILALTALAMPGDRERCLAAGADDYLTKPVNLRTLLASIDAQLHQRKEHSHDGAADDPHSDR